MRIDFSQIKNKQRILITGNEGTKEILSLVTHVLATVKRPFDVLQADRASISDAPVIFMEGFDGLNRETNRAYFNELNPHIALFHKITEDIPDGYQSFEEYVGQYEMLANNLPKAGAFIYYESDNVAMMIGKNEREDVKNVEYGKLKHEKIDEGYKLKIDKSKKVKVKTKDPSFAGEAGAVKALLKRIGVTEEQFLNALKTYNNQ